MFKWLKSILPKMKGESGDNYNRRAHAVHKDNWAQAKKRSGQWLSKADYQRKTGRPGRK